MPTIYQSGYAHHHITFSEETIFQIYNFDFFPFRLHPCFTFEALCAAMKSYLAHPHDLSRSPSYIRFSIITPQYPHSKRAIRLLYFFPPLVTPCSICNFFINFIDLLSPSFLRPNLHGCKSEWLLYLCVPTALGWF